MRLARKITLLFLLPFVALLVVLAYRATQRDIGIYESQVSTDLILTGKAIRPTFAEVWRLEGEARALELLASASRDLSEVDVRWIPRGATPLASRTAGDTSDLAVVQRDPAGNGGEGRITAFLPVVDEKMPPGALKLSRSLEKEGQLTRNVIRDKSLTTAATVIVCIVLGSVVGTWFVGKPVRSLVLHARRIGSGDLSHAPWHNQRDELGQLGDELNAMCDQLAGARQRVADEEEARIRVIEQLRHADRLATVGKLAAGLAHELGTPLNVVSGRAKMISSGRLAPEAVGRNAAIIGGQAARMTKIIRGLLDFARRGTATRRLTDLTDLVKDTVGLLAPLSNKRGIALSFDGAESPRTLEADAGQIEQVLTNLLVNAIDATPDGGIVAVQLAEEEATPPAGHEGRPGLYLRLDVRDQGTGIRKEDLARVFEPFFTTKEVGEGTGLGLSVAHGIVHDHGGWIAVESEPNHGSCFSVYLPKLHA